MAHGYLLHQFFSQFQILEMISMVKFERGYRLLIEIIKEVKVWPKNKVLGARVNGDDWLKNGTSIKDCIYGE